MYLLDFLNPIINKKLKTKCIGKIVSFEDFNMNVEKTILCKNIKFYTFAGQCWIDFTDEKNKVYTIQGIDIWFEIN